VPRRERHRPDEVSIVGESFPSDGPRRFGLFQRPFGLLAEMNSDHAHFAII
jgi:hypothetical protein